MRGRGSRACLVGETVAYLGYVLTIRDIARVDRGPDMDLAVSTKTVVAGFGVFAATRTSGGFAVDYWALRREGAGRRDAVGRVLALGFLEYATLSIVALVASIALYARVDGQASDSATLPALLVIPAFAFALWATSHKRSKRLSRPQPNGNWFRRTFADSVAGARKARTLLLSPREHGLGVLGMTLYWAGDIACLWAALQLVGGRQITISALILGLLGRLRPEPALAPGRRSRCRRDRPDTRARRDGRPLCTRLSRRADLPPVQLLASDRSGADADSEGSRTSRAVPAGRAADDLSA